MFIGSFLSTQKQLSTPSKLFWGESSHMQNCKQQTQNAQLSEINAYSNFQVSETWSGKVQPTI